MNIYLYKNFVIRNLHTFVFQYRKLPLKNTGDTLKGPDGTILVTAHWVFLTAAHDILYFEIDDS